MACHKGEGGGRLAPSTELRKSFEVALHAGTAAALLITLRDEVAEAVDDLNARRVSLIALSFAPPAVVGYTLERPIERRLGTPPTIAIALIAGAAVMAYADRRPQARRHQEAGACDAICLGVLTTIRRPTPRSDSSHSSEVSANASP